MLRMRQLSLSSKNVSRNLRQLALIQLLPLTTETTLTEDGYTSMVFPLQLTVNSSDAWSFSPICTAVGFVLYVSVVMVSREEKDRTENRRVAKA